MKKGLTLLLCALGGALVGILLFVFITRVIRTDNNNIPSVTLTETDSVSSGELADLAFQIADAIKANDFEKLALYPSDQAAPDRRWYLYRIALHPSYQGMGIGRTLIHFACHLADSAQKDLYLDCWAGNHSLRKFYSSAGFDPVGIFSEQDYKICVFSRPFARNP